MEKGLCLSAGILAVLCGVLPARLHAQAEATGPSVSATAGTAPDVRIPAVSTASVIELQQSLRKVVQHMLDRSPLFRMQWRSIESTRRLQVKVRFEEASDALRQRALTRFVRSATGVHATVIVNRGANVVEAMGHEFEHVLEQIEGLELKLLVGQKGSGVTREDPGYETRRAIAAGERVLREYRRDGGCCR